MKRTLLALALASITPAKLAMAQTFSLYRVAPETTEQLDAIAEQFEIVSREGQGLFEVYVPSEKMDSFKKLVPSAALLTADVDEDWRPHWENKSAFAAGYHDWQSVQDFIVAATLNYPTLASTQVYGLTKAGRPLTYLRLSSGPAERGTAKPKLFLDSATHGDELISVEVLLTLVDELLKGYGTDERLTRMLDKTDIFVSFVVNPDGYIKQQRYENFVDPNRSYPWPGDPTHKPTPSIQALMNLYETEKFDGSISFHAYGRLLMYPWAYTAKPLEDDTDRLDFQNLTDALAFDNGYKHGSIADTIYVAKGSSADYYYWKYKTKALAVELTTTKVPASSKIPKVVDEAREMVWGFIEHFYL